MTDEDPSNLSGPAKRSVSPRVRHRRVPHDLGHSLAASHCSRPRSADGTSVAAVLGGPRARDGGCRNRAERGEPDSLHRIGFAGEGGESAGRRHPEPDCGAKQGAAGRDSHGHGFAQRLNRLGPSLLVAGAIAALAASPAAAQAQYSSACGVTGDATAPTTITYDPFAPGGLSQATIPLILQRTRNLVGGRTSSVSLILTAPAGAPPLTVTYQGSNVLYPEGTTAGRPRALSGSGAAGEIRHQFGGLFASDLSPPLNLRVSVPPGTDLVAGEPVYLDVLYICSADGLMLEVPVPTRLNRAIRVDVRVVSALQAHYAGSVLDFGEIGDLTTEAVQADPERYATSSANSLRVRSSGPYDVQLRSQNDFRLTFPGGNTGNSAQTIRYAVRFLGQEVASNGAFGTRSCARAGVGGAAGVLPIRARLTEGGAGKTPSPSYADTITITFTPILLASAAQSCAGL